MKKVLIISVILFFANIVHADPYAYSSNSQDYEKVVELVNTDLLNWINDPVIIQAILKANNENSSRSDNTILEQDELWRSGDTEFQNKYLNNTASDFLKSKKSMSGDLYSEIFIMDFQGCNVAQSDVTSDFWQGDESKFKESYNNSNGSVFIDEVEYDESTETYSVQVSLPIVDPASKKVIGAITVGIDMSKL